MPLTPCSPPSKSFDLPRRAPSTADRWASAPAVSTGPVIAGSVGGSGRQSYTVYGDTVNLASRLEALNKERGTSIIVDASTVAILTTAPFQEMGQVSVRGFNAPVGIYSPVEATRQALSRSDQIGTA